jgi:hypothetical protein
MDADLSFEQWFRADELEGLPGLRRQTTHPAVAGCTHAPVSGLRRGTEAPAPRAPNLPTPAAL